MRLCEQRTHGGAHTHRAVQIHGDDALERFDVVFFVAADYAGAVDEYVERVECVEQRGDAGSIRDIEFFRLEPCVPPVTTTLLSLKRSF